MSLSDCPERMQRAGIARVAVTSIAGHFCIDSFKAVSPVPVVDLLDAVQLEGNRRCLKRVGLLGTRVVMESRFYGVLEGVEVVAPADELTDADIRSTASQCMSTEHRDQSDAVRALWLAQLTERTGRVVVADEELLQGKRMLKGFDNCVTRLLRYHPWIA